MKVAFIILSVIAILSYFTMMSGSESAPQQAVAAGVGCFFAIFARIARLNIIF